MVLDNHELEKVNGAIMKFDEGDDLNLAIEQKKIIELEKKLEELVVDYQKHTKISNRVSTGLKNAEKLILLMKWRRRTACMTLSPMDSLR